MLKNRVEATTSPLDNIFVKKRGEFTTVSALGNKAFSGGRALSSSIHVDPSTGSPAIFAGIQSRDNKTLRLLQRQSLSALTFLFFRKFKFTGKGYRVRKKRALPVIKLNFGHSHKVFMLFGGCMLKKTSKYRLSLVSNIPDKLRAVRRLICSVRQPSHYTKRGLRASKQLMYKRPGKKSTY